MKVLVKGKEIVSFPLYGGGKLETIKGEQVESATVAEMPEGKIKLAIAKDLAELKKTADDNNLRAFTEVKDFTRDLKWIAKRLADVEVGTEGVTMYDKGSKIGLNLPEGVEKDRAEGLEVGDVIAVGPTISPKALMNCRGLVVAINGRVEVEIEEDDLNRVLRATGRQFKNPVRLPKAVVEKIA